MMLRYWSCGVAIVLLCACGAGAAGFEANRGGPTGWDVNSPSVPKGVEPPIVEGGLLLNSYRGSDRVVVTMMFGPGDRDRIAATYDAWSIDRSGVKTGKSFDVGGRIAWSDVWTTAHSVARMTECINGSSGEFDNLCVALTTWVGSVP